MKDAALPVEKKSNLNKNIKVSGHHFKFFEKIRVFKKN